MHVVNGNSLIKEEISYNFDRSLKNDEGDVGLESTLQSFGSVTNLTEVKIRNIR